MPRHYGDKTVYEYKGFFYRPEDEVEPDVIKTWHGVYIKDADGEFKSDGWISWSPYGAPHRVIFEMWIDMGRPTREAMGGNQEKNYREFYERWRHQQAEDAILGV